MKNILLLAILTLAACLKDETITGQTESSEKWVLQSINNEPVGVVITLQFPEKGIVSGQAPCNRYHARQTAPLPWFELTPIVATRMACEHLRLEQSYFDALSNMTLIERSANSLLISNPSGQALQFTLR
jgi:heat shock protein HslJ